MFGFERETAKWTSIALGVVVLLVAVITRSLDVAYLTAAALLLRSPRWRHDAQAVLVQGTFLLLLDGTAARALR